MSIGITQLIIIIIIGVILFGNIPKIFKDISVGIVAFKNTLEKTSTSEKSEVKEVEEKKDPPKEEK